MCEAESRTRGNKECSRRSAGFSPFCAAKLANGEGCTDDDEEQKMGASKVHIQALREAHFAEMQEFYLKISRRYQQDEMLPHAKQSENFEKLRRFKMFLERVLALLQISKSSITIKVKEKLPYYEKQISGLLSTNRRPRLVPVQQQGQQQLQHPVGHAPQHQPSQVLPVQQHENHGNQAHQLNMTVSITTIELEVPSRMQHGSVTSPTSAAPSSRLQQIMSSLPFNWIWSKMEILRRLLSVDVVEGTTQLKNMAVRFEEKMYIAAVNQSDYLRKISLKMLSMETKTQQNTPMNPQTSVNQNSTDTGIPPQVNNQGQTLAQIPLVDQSLGRQQLLAQNLQNNTPAPVQSSSSLSASPSITGLTQSTITNFGHASNMQNMPGISHSSVNNSLSQGTTTDIYANTQRHVQGRQQQQSQNPLLYQNQLQPQLIKQKIHNNALLQPSMQQQQQQQSLLQANQLQPSQQSVMQMSSSLASGQSSMQQSPATTIQSASQSALQQNQLSSIQQSVSSLLPQHVQAIARQSQQLQSSLHQQTNLQTQQQQQQQQQQQLIGQQANMQNMSNIQTNQLLSQQNNIVDIKQQQQQQRLPVQQNNLISMQQSQQLLNQHSLSLHQQQLGQQTNIQGLQQQQQSQSQQQHQQQQQLLGSLQNISNMQSHQHSIQLLQQSKNVPQTQQQLQQPSMSLLQSQGQQSHHLSSQQQLMSQFQSQPGQLQQPLAMQQQSNSMQREMQQRLQASGALLQSMEQQKQFMQSQRGNPEVSSSSKSFCVMHCYKNSTSQALLFMRLLL
ncbi:mediator of RNA polymerase II transcription subunit 15a-like [Phalaenopsis equestris]|uniref:mediator of RNA polymerase II transcription subunit 15a-like n=1 Tax=Phalaenopsis equestris TaxID=78828 RepID=UPI0009E5B79A|nr:mediator of RNA polymerase II transcription subunit 15a-like [Phalaenopsis equestris]